MGLGLNFDGKGTAVAPVTFDGNAYGGAFGAFNVNANTGTGSASGAGSLPVSPLLIVGGLVVLLLIFKRRRKG